MKVTIDWFEADNGALELSRCLYAYTHPRTDHLLYIGKADFQSVRQRFAGRHKEEIYDYLAAEHGLGAFTVLVGDLVLPESQRYSSALLSDVESLLIFRLRPPCNSSCTLSRISRPGLVVECRGAWPVRRSRFRDN